MIEEDYVSLETAKLLEKKGFDWDCESKKFYPEPDYDQESPNGVYAPTLQTARKWLRKVYNIHIGVNITYSENPEKFPPKYFVYISNTKTGNTLIKPGCCLAWKNLTPKGFDSPEEACEAAIKYCLENLI
jgi:hypothetical protein